MELELQETHEYQQLELHIKLQHLHDTGFGAVI